MKYLLILIVVLNTSFVEVKKTYWKAVALIKTPDVQWGWAEIIETDTKDKAIKIWLKFLKNRPELKDGNISIYKVYEIKKEDILK